VNHFCLAHLIVLICAVMERVKQANPRLIVLKTVHIVVMAFVKLLEAKMFLPAKQIVEPVVIRSVNTSSKILSCVLRTVVHAVMMFVM